MNNTLLELKNMSYKDENNQRNACCTDCNNKVVLPARMTEITLSQLKKKGKENE